MLLNYENNTTVSNSRVKRLQTNILIKLVKSNITETITLVNIKIHQTNCPDTTWYCTWMHRSSKLVPRLSELVVHNKLNQITYIFQHNSGPGNCAISGTVNTLNVHKKNHK